MQSILNTKYIILFSLILFLGVFIFLGDKKQEGKISFENGIEELSFWVEQIESLGGKEAYALFGEMYGSETKEQHAKAHLFGEALYKALGGTGLLSCDSRYGFGCYHGLFGVALHEEGVEKIKDLDALCVKNYGPLGTGCQHGIGHGLLEFFGYTNVSDALSACRYTTQLVPVLGCTSGVFMEYLHPLERTGEGEIIAISSRVFKEEKPYTICDDMEAPYSFSCYFELPGWWSSLAHQRQIPMGELCGDIIDRENKKFCFLGLGVASAHRMIFDGDTKERVFNACRVEKDYFHPECLGGAEWVVKNDSRGENLRGVFCAEAGEGEKSICEEASRIEEMSYVSK